ncbi:MAG TPA: hypothetical protein VIK97_08010, partial [Casimicrobiaceae bacterium]
MASEDEAGAFAADELVVVEGVAVVLFDFLAFFFLVFLESDFAGALISALAAGAVDAAGDMGAAAGAFAAGAVCAAGA